MEFLQNRRSSENQKPPENRQKSGLFWASPFCNAPSLDTVDFSSKSKPNNSEPIFGKGMRRSTFRWRKGLFSEKGGGNLVRISTGKAIQWRAPGPFSEPPDSEKWKVAVLIPFPKTSLWLKPILLQNKLVLLPKSVHPIANYHSWLSPPPPPRDNCKKKQVSLQEYLFPTEVRFPASAENALSCRKNAVFRGRMAGNRRKLQEGFRAQESRTPVNFHKICSCNGK